eukprot:TRINITY_DN2755_c0_g1_i5.p1 TRINITY_DN2755_c0_g1~~TRINITY_DN2755_c0_g1_i5.p1  ORF type:complete len:172 (+),score=14.23 TRINITY_DN2755_c0_g1_i5:124-639(+)
MEERMPCLIATDLVREVKRTGGRITPFSEEKKNKVVEQINQLFNEISEVREYKDKELLIKSVPLVNAWTEAIKNNVRLMMVYLYYRLSTIESMIWDIGSVHEEVTPFLSEPEKSFADEYSELLMQYQLEFEEIDLDLRVCNLITTSVVLRRFILQLVVVVCYFHFVVMCTF